MTELEKYINGSVRINKCKVKIADKKQVHLQDQTAATIYKPTKINYTAVQ